MSVADSITSFKQFEGDTDLRVSLGPVRGAQEQTDRQTDDSGGGGGGDYDDNDVMIMMMMVVVEIMMIMMVTDGDW